MRRILHGAAALALTAAAQAQSEGVELCKSVNTDCHEAIPPQQGWYVDLTPTNSLHLREHYL
ncbi:hypothetical protein [Streptomyces sp. UG1]|uniref:hypothetical protein n=1 Tax=Streptomyces sp. UG1 TaxID=3417652 RepID=UPI003CFB6D5F